MSWYIQFNKLIRFSISFELVLVISNGTSFYNDYCDASLTAVFGHFVIIFVAHLLFQGST